MLLLTSSLAFLLGICLGVALCFVLHAATRKHWILPYLDALAVASGLAISRYLILESSMLLDCLLIFNAIGLCVGTFVGIPLENRLRR